MEVPSKHVSVIDMEARSIYETETDYKSLTSFSTMACLLVASACGVSSTLSSPSNLADLESFT